MSWLFPKEKRPEHDLTIYLFLAPRLRLSGAVPLLPLCTLPRERDNTTFIFLDTFCSTLSLAMGTEDTFRTFSIDTRMFTKVYKVKQSRYWPGVVQRVPGSIILSSTLHFRSCHFLQVFRLNCCMHFSFSLCLECALPLLSF